MRTPEELLNDLEDCMDLGLTAKQRDTIAEAMKVWKWELNQEKTLPIHPVMSTLRVCGTGCNGIVISGICNNCKADCR